MIKNMNSIKLDSNYNVKTRGTSSYTDHFDGIVEEILKAQEQKIISKNEAALLLGLAVRKSAFQLKRAF